MPLDGEMRVVVAVVVVLVPIVVVVLIVVIVAVVVALPGYLAVPAGLSQMTTQFASLVHLLSCKLKFVPSGHVR